MSYIYEKIINKLKNDLKKDKITYNEFKRCIFKLRLNNYDAEKIINDLNLKVIKTNKKRKSKWIIKL
ncbi:MAG: hypothetical protein QXD48_03865 [Candidatus Aenigmatarchaeota archaeon]